MSIFKINPVHGRGDPLWSPSFPCHSGLCQSNPVHGRGDPLWSPSLPACGLPLPYPIPYPSMVGEIPCGRPLPIMSLKHPINHFLLLCLLLCSLAACDLLPSTTTTTTPTTIPTTQPTDQGTPQLNTWYGGTPGVEVRYEDWKSPGNNEDTVTIVRFDLRHITLSVAYQPMQPLTMNEWMQKERATAIINGGYFDNQNNTTALVVSNGQSFGTSYNGFGGMLSVDSQGHIHLRS